MRDFLTALGLVLVIEGAAYALFPQSIQRMMEQAVRFPPAWLRAFGLAAAVVGTAGVWLARSIALMTP